MGVHVGQKLERGSQLPSVQSPQPEKPVEAKKERGHGRGRKVTLHVVGGSPELRGVPLVGTGPGGLSLTRPGGELGNVKKLAAEARELNEHAREIARQKMMEARERLRTGART